MNRHLILLAALTLAACSPEGESSDAAAPEAIAAAAAELPAGTYMLDKAHASLIFRVSHLGFSNYTARFTRFDATLELDPANPKAARLAATVDASSIETDFPDPETLDFNAVLRGPDWLDTANHPEMTFRSISVTRTAPNAAQISGELTLRGVTRPVTLDAVYNGGWASHPLDPHTRIGFSARGELKRSEFGMTFGIPEPGSTLGVGDAVEILIETEFVRPVDGPPPD